MSTTSKKWWKIPEEGIRLALKRKMTTSSVEAALLSIAVHLFLIFFGGSTVLWGNAVKQDVVFQGEKTERAELTKRSEPLPVNIQKLQRKLPDPKVRRVVSSAVRLQAPVTLPAPELRQKLINPSLRPQSLSSRSMPAKLDIGVSGVDFFGARSKGEKIIFILDASKQMMEDEKGGYNTYRYAKDEIHKMVDAMPSATLFNVMVYSGSSIDLFSPKIIPATPENRSSLKGWLAPINSDPYNVGQVRREYSSSFSYPSYLGDQVSYWLQAVQAAMEQQADAIFVLCGSFGRYYEPTERGSPRAEPDPDDLAEYNEEMAEVRAKAQKIFDKENAARARKGLPPKIVYDWNRYMREELRLTLPQYPSSGSSGRYRDPRDPMGLALDHLDQVAATQYTREDQEAPRVSFVYLTARDSRGDREYDETVMFNYISDEFDGSFEILRGEKTMHNLTY